MAGRRVGVGTIDRVTQIYLDRLERVRAAMSEQGVDALLLSVGHDLPYLTGYQAMPLERAGWMILTKRLALFFLALAVANEAIWRTMSTDTWVSFKTFGLPISIFAFFMAQSGLFSRYGTSEEEKES